VYYEGGAAGAVFNTSSNGTNAAVTSKICGFGSFYNNSGQSTGHVVNSAATGSYLEIHALAMSASGAACIRSAGSTGALTVKAGELTGGSDVILIAGAGADNHVEARRIYTSAANAVRITAGAVHIRSRNIESSVAAAVAFTGSDSARSTIEAHEIKSQSSYAFHYNGTGPIVDVRGARIVSGFADATGYAVYVQSAASDKVILRDCVLIVDTSATASLYAANSNTNVHCLNGVSANKAKHSNVVVIRAALTVDSLIS